VPQNLLDGPVRFCQINFSTLPEVPMVKEWISNATYFRWMLPSALGEDYNALFYLDTDTYLSRPGIERLFSAVDPSVALAAVVDFQSLVRLDEKRKQSFEAKVRDLGGRNGEYFNAGVLLIQPELFLQKDMTRQYVEAMKKNVEYLPIHKDQDQGAMNLAFADQIVPLNPLYNWRTGHWLNPKLVKEFDPYVLHFVGRGKPWNLQDDPFVASYADEYLSYFEGAFPEFRPVPAPRSTASRLENPRHSFKPFESIRIALHRRRADKKRLKDWNSDYDWKVPRMREAIAAAEVG
jgi:lipopolysaccharide biosynthesis glycosyltransferase